MEAVSNLIDPIPSFRGPSPLDLLNEFMDQYGGEIDRHAKLLRDGFVAGQFDTRSEAYCGGGDKLSELRRLEHFRPSLHRLIQAFVREAVEPMQKTIWDATVLSPRLYAPGDIRGDAGSVMGRAFTAEEEAGHAKEVDTVTQWLLERRSMMAQSGSAMPAPSPESDLERDRR